MSKISDRQKHTRIVNGFCVICGEHGKLSIDHVPPQGSITVTKVEQYHVCEMIGLESKSTIKGVASPNGSKFKTICHACNHELGKSDTEVCRVNKELTDKIKHHFQSASNIYNHVSVKIDPIKYSRAMIGHILSATSVTECMQKNKSTPYFTPLQDFVLGKTDSIDSTHDIYYWFYPRNRHISAKYVCFVNEGHTSGLSLLAFYPLAFLITPKDAGIYPAHAQKLNTDSSRLILNLSMHNSEYIDFPFIELKGNSMFALVSHQAIVSYPIKN